MLRHHSLIWLGLALTLGVTGCSIVGFTPLPNPFARPSLVAYLSLQADDEVGMVNITDKQPDGQIKTGDGPVNIALNTRNDLEYLYSANENDGTVSFINLRTGQSEQSIQAGSQPWGIAVTPARLTDAANRKYSQRIVVACGGDNTIAVIEPIARSTSLTKPAIDGFHPHGVVTAPYNPDKKEADQVLDAYVISDQAVTEGGVTGGIVYKLSSSGQDDHKIATGAKRLWKGAISPDGTTLFVTDRDTNFLYRFNLTTFQFEGQVQLDGNGCDVVVYPDKSKKLAYVSIPAISSSAPSDYNGKIDIVDYSSSPGTVVSRPAVWGTYSQEATYPQSLAINTTGSELWVALQNHLGYFTLDTGSNKGMTADSLRMTPYTTSPGQAPPITSLVLGSGVQ